MPIYVLAGEEDFLLERRVAELKSKLLDPQWVHFNFKYLNAPDLKAVIDASGTVPFGPGKCLVLVDRCNLFTKKRSKAADAEKSADKVNKSLLEDFDQALSMVAPDTNLVFACPYNFDATLKVAKIMEKHAKLEAFPKERFFVGSANPKLIAWCGKEAELYGATIDSEAISYLLDSTEANLRQISQEIAKAAVYLLPETHITKDVLSNLSPYHSHVFSLVDHLANARRQETLMSLNELLSRSNGMPIMAFLQTTFSRWINLKAKADKINYTVSLGKVKRELTTGELARKLVSNGMKPYAVEMDLKRIATMSTDKLAENRVKLCQLEYMVKTGQLSDVEALTMFIAD